MADDAYLSYEETLLSHDNNGYLIRYDTLDPSYQGIFDQMVRVWVDDYDPPEGEWGEPDEEATRRSLILPRAVPATDSQGVPRLDAEGRLIPRPTTVYDAVARKYRGRGDNPIPVLCHQEHLDPVAVCRVCVVKVSVIKRGQRRWERKLLPACQLRVDNNMIIHTANAPRQQHRDEIGQVVRTLTKLLAADHLPGTEPDGGRPRRLSLPIADVREGQPFNELAKLAAAFNVTDTPYASNRPRRERPETHQPKDPSSPLVRVDHGECILCDRCVRACDTVKQNLVIGRAGKGYNARVAFDLDDPMGNSSCVACGECMLTCPTGALTLQPPHQARAVDPGWDRDLRKRLDPVVHRLAHKGDVPTIEFLQPASGTAGVPQALELFRNLPVKQLEWFLEYRSIIRRPVSRGEVLCREGEYGAEAFLLLSGRYGIELPDQAARDAGGRLQENFLETPVPLEAAAERGRRTITLTADQLLIVGEMSCINNQKRAATIRVEEGGEILEVRRNVLYYLQRHRESREILKRVYNTRALANLVKDFSLFRGLSEADRERCTRIVQAAGPASDTASEPSASHAGPSGAGPDDRQQSLAERGLGEGLDDRVTLLSAEPGQLLIRQGEDAREVYLLRVGHIKAVDQQAGETERVLGHLKPGTRSDQIGLVGEIALLSKVLRYRRWAAQLSGQEWEAFGRLAQLLSTGPGGRPAEPPAAGPTPPGWDANAWRALSGRLGSRQAREDLLGLARQFPDPQAWLALKRFFSPPADAAGRQGDWETLERDLEQRGLMREQEFGKRTATCYALDHVELVRIPERVFLTLLAEVPGLFQPFRERMLHLLEQQRRGREVLPGLVSGQFLRQGLYNAQKLFAFDLTRCTRCDECTRACADSHGDGVSRLLREGLRFGDYLVGISCRSCTDPYCMDGCPVDSIHRDGRNLNIQIESHCIGCGLCERNCPYGSIQMIPGKQGHLADVRVAKTCDLCEGLIQPGQKTYCVYACPHDAAFRLSGEELIDRVHQRLAHPVKAARVAE